MESIAKTTVTCDNCKTVLNKDDDNAIDRIKATLAGPDGKNKDFIVCDEQCLLELLQKRADRKKAAKKKSKASLEVDFTILKR